MVTGYMPQAKYVYVLYIHLLIFSVIFSATGIARSQWFQTLGPDGGTVNCLTTKGEYVFAGLYKGIVFRSHDDGKNWSPASTGIWQTNIHALFVDNEDLFAGTDSAGIFRSSDNGMIWVDVSIPDAAGEVLAFTVLDTFLYAAVYGDGVYRSSDRGTTWELPSYYFTAEDAVELYTFNNMLFAGTRYNALKSSSDQGETWTKTGFSGFGQISQLASWGSVMYATSEEAVYRSLDTGQTWYEILGKHAPVMLIDSNGILIASYSEVYHSIDSGSTWQNTSLGNDAHQVLCLAANGSKVYVGTFSGGIYSSFDHGKFWEAASRGLWSSNVHALTSVGGRLFAGTEDGIFRMDFDKISWQLSGLPAKLVFALESFKGDLFAGIYYGGVYRSGDRGVSWFPSLDYPYIVVDFLGIGDDLLASTSEGIFLTTDEGETWKSVGTDTLRSSSLAIHGADIFAASYKGPYVSHDNGRTWAPSGNDGLSNVYVDMLVSDGTYLYSGAQNKIFRSANGATWELTNLKLPQFIHVNALVHDNGKLFAGTDIGVYLSVDQGAGWTNISQGLVTPYVNTLMVFQDDLYVGTTGGGVWRHPLSQFSVERSSSSNPHVYPNPLSSFTTIEFYLPKSETVDIKIVDMLGVEHASIVSSTFHNGNHSYTWDASDVPGGMYMCFISIGDQIECKPLLLVR